MTERREIARTAGRALDLLTLLVDRGQHGLTARELSEQLGAPRTSIADLLKVLAGRGFVGPTTDGRGWRLDSRVLQLGNAYLHEFSVREVGRPAMRELSRRSGLTCQMAVLEGKDVVYIERQDARRTTEEYTRSEPRLVTDLGSRLPAYCTSLGKAMLAALPEEELDRLYAAPAQLSPRTKNTITSVARLKTELTAIRRRGYAVDNEEATDGIICIGSAIIGSDGRPEAAISLAGLRGRLSAETIEDLGRMVGRAAAHVSSARGGVVRRLPVSRNGARRRRRSTVAAVKAPALARRRRRVGAA
ncbi:MAG: IclR family transcriptional regulator [Chloroflexi bacterium]|nr:MAG: IclR family transcriptional regulator [Chloroflexota bacterium]